MFTEKLAYPKPLDKQEGFMFSLTSLHKLIVAVILMDEGNIRVKSWEEFKSLVRERRPKSVVFILEQNGLSPNKELTNLRLILPGDRRYYIYIDRPKGEKLKETEIPLHRNKRGVQNLDEDEVKDFLLKQFEREKVEICSFWSA